MDKLELKLTGMAHGGSAVGRAMGPDKKERAIFVPYAIPGETVLAQIRRDKGSYAQAELLEVRQASLERVKAPCAHFTVCGGCHLQHMTYEAQLKAKETVLQDQLQRLGGFKQVTIRPILPHPYPYGYRLDIHLSPTAEGKLGFWSPSRQQVIPIELCQVLHPRLQELWQDIDLELPGLRKLTLRMGDDEELMAALEVNGVEPPELEADFPVSVAMVLPDKTAVSLVGNFSLIRTVKQRPFRISPGCFFPTSTPAATMLVDVMLKYAQLNGRQTVLELYSGVGLLTAFLSAVAKEVIAIESNKDAVADTAVNLEETDNVSIYEGTVEQILPSLKIKPDVIVLHPPDEGLSPPALRAVIAQRANRIVYLSSDVATLARDGKLLAKAGYRFMEVQPVDCLPQHFQIDTVSLWQKTSNA